MTTYLIVETQKADKVRSQLLKFGDVVVLGSGNKDFASYTELFDDQGDKVIGIAPGTLEWKVPNTVLDKIQNLKGISTLSSWAHYIDLEYCKKRGIVVTNTLGANSQSVAEHAIWMMLSLARKLPIQMSDDFRTKRDQDHKHAEILGKTAGIVGMGNIGSRIAKMAQGLGMNVVYWSPNTRNDAYTYLEFNEVLETSDFIFNCVETYEGTKGLFSKKSLSLLPKNSYYLSVVGGLGYGQEDADYLIEMINSDKLAGLAIENEHEPNYKLPEIKKGKNVFIAGPYAWYTKEAEVRSLEKWVEAISGIINKNYIYRVV